MKRHSTCYFPQKKSNNNIFFATANNNIEFKLSESRNIIPCNIEYTGFMGSKWNNAVISYRSTAWYSDLKQLMSTLLEDNWISWDQLQLVVVFSPITRVLNLWSRFEIWTQHTADKGLCLPWTMAVWIRDARTRFTIYICSYGKRVVHDIAVERETESYHCWHALVQWCPSQPNYQHDGVPVLTEEWVQFHVVN